MENSIQKVAIFASGSGTNAENLIKYFEQSDNIKVALLVCNRSKAKVLLRAQKLKVPSLVIGNSDIEMPTNLLETLHFYKINYIALAGFLKKIPTEIIQTFPNKIVNIHPALLPKFGGKGMYGNKVHEAVKENGETETGITIHEVNEIYDEGPIIFQAKCAVLANDTPNDIAAKIHDLEYEYFPKVLEQFILKKQR